MEDQICRLQSEAKRIASHYRQPEFYRRFQAPIAHSRRLYFTHPLVVLLREKLEPLLKEDLGHGVAHSARVSQDCASLISVELEKTPMDPSRRERLMVLGQLSGLLHDISRDQEQHAQAGARKAAKILAVLPLSAEEIQGICRAIENHEAFIKPLPCPQPAYHLISDCLYDADKFRWGPDTFTDTLWHMMDHRNITPDELLARFPWGIGGVRRIGKTFRSSTGKQYGPEFIEIGIAIGKEIYRYLLNHFGDQNGI